MTRETDSMSARNDVDSQTPIHFTKPPALPATAMTHPELSDRVRKLWREMSRSLARVPAEFHLDVRKWLAEVEELGKGLTLMLPGMPEPEPRKARGTLPEVHAYFVTRGLPKSDAEYFHAKCEGCGWKINRSAIKDWKAVVRAWEAAKYFPSQKVTSFNGSQVVRPPSIAEKEIEREARLIRGGR